MGLEKQNCPGRQHNSSLLALILLFFFIGIRERSNPVDEQVGGTVLYPFPVGSHLVLVCFFFFHL